MRAERGAKIGQRTRFRFSFAGMLLVTSFVTHSAIGQTGKTSDSEYRLKYRQAAALMGEKKHTDAKRVFLELWNKAKTHEVATSLGQIELVAHNYVEAAQYLSFAIATYPPHQDEKMLSGLRKWLDDAKKHVATAELTCNVNGAVVSIDGTDVGKTPLDSPLFVAPGRHALLVNMDGYKMADRAINGAEGSTEKVEITMVAVEKAMAPAATIATPPPAAVAVQPFQEPPKDVTSSGPNSWILVGGGAITVGGLITGLVFNSKASSEYDKAQALQDKFGRSGCFSSAANSAECSQQRSYAKDGDRDRVISNVAFGVGGVALVATVVYWVWPRNRTSANVSATSPVVASIGSGNAWIGINGSY